MGKDAAETVGKGLIVGSTMLVPGVSGGSMAMILGIYDRLIGSVSSFFKHKKESIRFLLLFCIGAGLGMFLFARPVLFLIEQYPKPMLYFFIGAVAGGIPMILEKTEVKKLTLPVIGWLFLGVVCVVFLSFFPEDLFSTGGRAGTLLMVLAGIVAAIALVLPGISVSYMLLVMGIYDTLIQAISRLSLGKLAPFAIGLALGVVLSTKLLETAMQKKPGPTYLIILGFVIGSAGQIFPGLPEGILWLICPVMLLAGFWVIRIITLSSQRNAPSGQ